MEGGYVKNSMGNGEAKELICMTHGHEQRGLGSGGGNGGPEWREVKVENGDNCNSIMIKYTVKNCYPGWCGSVD